MVLYQRLQSRLVGPSHVEALRQEYRWLQFSTARRWENRLPAVIRNHLKSRLKSRKYIPARQLKSRDIHKLPVQAPKPMRIHKTFRAWVPLLLHVRRRVGIAKGVVEEEEEAGVKAIAEVGDIGVIAGMSVDWCMACAVL